MFKHVTYQEHPVRLWTAPKIHRKQHLPLHLLNLLLLFGDFGFGYLAGGVT